MHTGRQVNKREKKTNTAKRKFQICLCSLWDWTHDLQCTLWVLFLHAITSYTEYMLIYCIYTGYSSVNLWLRNTYTIVHGQLGTSIVCCNTVIYYNTSRLPAGNTGYQPILSVVYYSILQYIVATSQGYFYCYTVQYGYRPGLSVVYYSNQPGLFN
jgi:hypothetical protein